MRLTRLGQYSDFVAAVELSLGTNFGEDAAGAQRLLEALKRQPYARSVEVKKQLSILFSFIDGRLQPTNGIRELLTEVSGWVQF